jgi:hypothetical protein
LQADEVLSEQDYPALREALQKYENDAEVQGLLFKYIHFYGSYDVVAESRRWYRNEIRIVKKDSKARSFRDAQGFRIDLEEKLKVKPANASVYHYGWVKHPQKMGEKTKLLNHLWHGNKRDREFENFKYKRSYGLRKFKGTHPEIMRELIANENWDFDPSMALSDWTLKDINLLASDIFEKIFCHRIGEYKPYKLI